MGREYRIKGMHYKGETNTQGCFVQVLRGSGVDGEGGDFWYLVT